MFFIEPKPMEPSKHQYDFDAATVIGFLKEHGLQDDFKLNLEVNHATLAQMDTFARALLIANKVMTDSDYLPLRKKRYASFDKGKGADITKGS